MEVLMVALLAVVYFGGFVFPVVGLAMSWREWFRVRATAVTIQSGWRRIATISSLSFLTAAFPLWAYAAVREIRGNYSYMFKSAQIARWSSLIVFVICLFAEGKVRRYLLVGAAGLLFFFGATIGELP